MTRGRTAAVTRGRTAAVLGAVAALLAAAVATAQTATLGRTAWGDPDLQGVWDFRTITPMERPRELAGKVVLTAEEAAGYEAEQNRRQNRDLVDPTKGGAIYPPASEGGVVPYNEFWYDRGSSLAEGGRTSLIVDPPDGRIPALVPSAAQQGRTVSVDVAGERPVRFRSGGIGADGPEDRALGERCLIGFNAGPPMIPSAYNNTVQVLQTPDHVVILNEMIHDARIVPLDRRPHLEPAIRQWMGDSRGRWDGDTLVVETTNFTDKTASFNPTIQSAAGTGATLRLVERFTRTGAGTLRYEFTVHDPDTFTRPFTGVIPMTTADGPLFEYACHEGNYGMFNLLSGARVQEEQEAR